MMLVDKLITNQAPLLFVVTVTKVSGKNVIKIFT